MSHVTFMKIFFWWITPSIWPFGLEPAHFSNVSLVMVRFRVWVRLRLVGIPVLRTKQLQMGPNKPLFSDKWNEQILWFLIICLFYRRFFLPLKSNPRKYFIGAYIYAEYLFAWKCNDFLKKYPTMLYIWHNETPLLSYSNFLINLKRS